MTVPHRRTRAFTVIEMIVVIVILGILAAIGTFAYRQVITSTHKKAAMLVAEQLAKDVHGLASSDQVPGTVVATDASSDWHADVPADVQTATHPAGVDGTVQVSVVKDGWCVPVVFYPLPDTPGHVDTTHMVASDTPDCQSPDTAPPSNVAGGSSGPVAAAGKWASVTTGWRSTCGLTIAGGTYCWGMGGNGDLGTGSTADQNVPTLVSTTQQFKSVTVGFAHACALNLTDDAWCWGNDGQGQLGDGNIGGLSTPNAKDQFTPVAVLGGHKWKVLQAGGRFNCGIDSGDDLYCWGFDQYGQLGDDAASGKDDSSGYIGTKAVPTLVAGNHKWMAVDAGLNQVCGLTTAGVAYCWGDNAAAGLGNTTTAVGGYEPMPVAVSTTKVFTTLKAGDAGACATTSTGAAYCWGRDTFGQLGDGNTGDVAGWVAGNSAAVNSAYSATPVRAAPGTLFTSVFSGGNHVCGIVSSGNAYCWGYDAKGQIGDGKAVDSSYPAVPTPALVAGSHSWVNLTGNGQHTCGLDTNNDVYCWGQGDNGRLGNGGTASVTAPVKVTDPA